MGDLIVDSTWYVNTKKLSPEAPIPTVYLISPDPSNTPGGAGLAASYANRNNIDSIFLTAAEHDYQKWLEDKGIHTKIAIQSPNIVKTRYIDRQSGYHMLRVDNDDIVETPILYKELMSYKLIDIIDEYNIGCIAILDYRKGMFKIPETCAEIVKIAKRNDIPVYVDTRGDVSKFGGINCLKLNEQEASKAMLVMEAETPLDLMETLKIDTFIITRGKRGAYLFNKENGQIKNYSHIPDLDKYTGTPDVTGCGDVFDINFCYNRFIEGLTPTESLELSVERATQFAYELVHNRL